MGRLGSFHIFLSTPCPPSAYHSLPQLATGPAYHSFTQQTTPKRPAMPHRPVCGTLSQNGYGEKVVASCGLPASRRLRPSGGTQQMDAGRIREDTKPGRAKKLFTLLDLCVSSLRRGHANLLCIVPILTDDPRRESRRQWETAF